MGKFSLQIIACGCHVSCRIQGVNEEDSNHFLTVGFVLWPRTFV